MIEVLTAPAHLAGARVVAARREDTGTELVLDRDGIAVLARDVRTTWMLPADLDRLREILGDAPEPPDVQRALVTVCGAVAGHLATPGSPAAALLAEAAARSAEYTTICEGSEDPCTPAAMPALRAYQAAVANAKAARGYVGRAVDTRTAALAATAASRGLTDPDTREHIVAESIAAGLSEDVARRSVIRGLVAAIPGGRARAAPSTPTRADSLGPSAA